MSLASCEYPFADIQEAFGDMGLRFIEETEIKDLEDFGVLGKIR